MWKGFCRILKQPLSRGPSIGRGSWHTQGAQSSLPLPFPEALALGCLGKTNLSRISGAGEQCDLSLKSVGDI